MHVRPCQTSSFRACAQLENNELPGEAPLHDPRVRGLSPRQTGEICCSDIDSNLQITILLHRNLLALELVHRNSALNASINDARAAMPL